jgi:hypothetical protein
MAKSVNKFIVKLTDVSQFQPKLMVTASPVKDKKNTFMVKIVVLLIEKYLFQRPFY